MEIKKGKYLHYKGDTVEVFGKAKHSETLEEFVVYRHTSGKRKNEKYFWVRPIKMFKEKVNLPAGGNGKRQPRFKYLNDGKENN